MKADPFCPDSDISDLFYMIHGGMSIDERRAYLSRNLRNAERYFTKMQRRKKLRKKRQKGDNP
jgi:hypothetical protein